MKLQTRVLLRRPSLAGEHDEMASAILVTTSRDLAEQVSKEVEGFVAQLSRKESFRSLWIIMVIS